MISCEKIEDCGREYTETGCLVRDASNTIFWITSDEEGRYKQRVNRGDVESFDDVPRAGKDRDLTLFETKTGYVPREIARALKPCSERSLVCVSGSCRSSSEVTAKVRVAEGCLAQKDGQAMLVDTKAKSYRVLTDSSGSAPSFYASCLRDAPTIADAQQFDSEYSAGEPIIRAWRQHYCQNAAPCGQSDLPVILSQRQTVLAARESKSVETIASVCRTDPEICTLFAPGVTLEECTRDPEACANAVIYPKDRCDFFPKGAGCLYRPPKMDESPRFYPFEKYAKMLEGYNSTLMLLGAIFAIGAIVYAVRGRSGSKAAAAE